MGKVKIFNEQAEIVNKDALETCDAIDAMVKSLFVDLFDRGMTQLEARALVDCLISSVLAGTLGQMLRWKDK